MDDSTDVRTVFACNVGGKSIRLEDLEIGVLTDIARAHDMDWITLMAVPCLSERAGFALVAKCAEVLGVKAPEKMTARELLDSFEQVPADHPDSIDSDGLPTKGAGAGQATE